MDCWKESKASSSVSCSRLGCEEPSADRTRLCVVLLVGVGGLAARLEGLRVCRGLFWSGLLVIISGLGWRKRTGFRMWRSELVNVATL